MGLIGTLLLLVGVAFALAYWRAPLWLWTVGTALSLVFLTSKSAGFGFLVVVICWLGWAVMAMMNSDEFRREYVSKPILDLFRKVLPKVSQTEQEALDAGTVWWDAELFSGQPNWRRLLDLPPPRLTDEEQAFLDGPTETLCKMLDDWEISHELRRLPSEVWQFIRDHGFLGMIIPKAYGGLEFLSVGPFSGDHQIIQPLRRRRC